MKYAKKSPPKGLFALIGAAAVVLIIVVVIIIAMVGGNNGEDAASTENTARQQTSATDSGTEATGTAGEGTTASTDETEGSQTTEPSADGSEDTTEATNSASEETQPSTSPTESTKPTGSNTGDVEITTPYATLYYPGEWRSFLRTEIDETNGYRVDFYADLSGGKSQKLFSLTFGGSGSDPIGTVQIGSGIKVNVYLTTVAITPDSSWSDSETNTVFSMQEALNDLLGKLSMEMISDTGEGAGASQEPTELPVEAQGYMTIDTPYTELRFPSKWANYLVTEIDQSNGYSIHFYGRFGSHKDQLLFSIHFGGTEGFFFGAVKDGSGASVEVRVSLFELVLDDSWTDSEKGLIYGMQEDLNYLLDHLG